MARLDLDDLPPKIAALLIGLAEGDEVLLVQHGAVIGRLTAAEPAAEAVQLEVPPEQHAAEVFENLRSSIEDDF